MKQQLRAASAGEATSEAARSFASAAEEFINNVVVVAAGLKVHASALFTVLIRGVPSTAAGGGALHPAANTTIAYDRYGIGLLQGTSPQPLHRADLVMFDQQKAHTLTVFLTLLGALVVLLMYTTRKKDVNEEDEGEWKRLEDEQRKEDEDEQKGDGEAAAGEDESSAPQQQVPQRDDSPSGRMLRKVANSMQIREEEGKALWQVNSENLIEDCGLSGMCVLDPKAICGVTGAKVWCVISVAAAQAFFLQFALLYWIYTGLTPRWNRPGAMSALPMSILFSAIYLHFVNCVSDLPRMFFLLRWVRQNQKTHTWLLITVFMMDSCIIPMITMAIGSLYLSNSLDINETILNSCAVAFITQVDNWILQVSLNMELLVHRTEHHKDLFVRIDRKMVQWIDWLVVIIPAIPIAFTVAAMIVANEAKL